MIELLLKEGHSINSTDSGARTALYYAAKNGLDSVMTMLLEHGADPNILPAGRTAWEEFVSDEVIITWLAQAGYKKRSIDTNLKQQIRHALQREQRPPLRLDQFPQVQAQRLPGSEGKAKEPRSGMTNLWKRLRGQ